jgi:hypothetical protein
MRHGYPFSLAALLALALAGRSAETDAAPTDEQLLQKANVGTEGPALLDFLRRHTGTEAQRERIAGLIRQLGDDHFPVRRQAVKDLQALGTLAAAQLRQALRHPDEEVKDQARTCLALFDEKEPPALTAAAVRLLRQRKPADTVVTLLAYVPFAPDETTEEEVLAGLVQLAVRESQVDPLLPPALRDPTPARRAAAALVLGRSGSAEQKTAVRGLLTDAEPSVRLRAAQGLIASRDKSGVAVLIALLDDPEELASPAEDLLICLAGARAPRVPAGIEAAVRRRRLELWAQWWKRTEAGFDLTRADADLLWFNPSLKARTTARQFCAALNQADAALLAQTTEFPFTMLPNHTFSRREDVDNGLANLLTAARQQGLTFRVSGLATVEEYARTAPVHEKRFLSQLRPANVRIVPVQVLRNDQPQSETVCSLFLQVDGPRAQVFALGGRPK